MPKMSSYHRVAKRSEKSLKSLSFYYNHNTNNPAKIALLWCILLFLILPKLAERGNKTRMKQKFFKSTPNYSRKKTSRSHTTKDIYICNLKPSLLHVCLSSIFIPTGTCNPHFGGRGESICSISWESKV